MGVTRSNVAAAKKFSDGRQIIFFHLAPMGFRRLVIILLKWELYNNRDNFIKQCTFSDLQWFSQIRFWPKVSMVHELAKLLVVLLLDVYQTVGTFVTTDTHAGVVRGYRVPTLAGSQLEIYMGIPFAEPPVGNLRFSPPVERKHWRPKILNATEFGAACPQPLKSVR